MRAISRLLGFVAVVLGVCLSFIHVRWGISCFVISVAFTQWVIHEDMKLHEKWTQETFFVMLESLRGLHGRLDHDRGLDGPNVQTSPSPSRLARESA